MAPDPLERRQTSLGIYDFYRRSLRSFLCFLPLLKSDTTAALHNAPAQRVPSGHYAIP